MEYNFVKSDKLIKFKWRKYASVNFVNIAYDNVLSFILRQVII